MHYLFFNKSDLEQIKNSKINVVFDPNGGTGVLFKPFFDSLGIKSIFINNNFGEFKRKIEPNFESLAYLPEHIKNESASFAAGFDCDADRVELILQNGELVSGNYILAIIAQDFLDSCPNPEKEVIVVNDATSYIVKEVIQKHGAKWKEVEVGEINVIEEMIKSKSTLGGEGSNGGIIVLPSMCRDGLLTVLFILKIMAKKNTTLKDLLDSLPKYFNLKEKIIISKNFEEIRQKVIEHYSKNGFEILLTGNKTGGLKAIKDNSWVWFRQSKTEDKVLRIITDSKSESTAKELQIDAKKLLDLI